MLPTANNICTFLIKEEVSIHFCMYYYERPCIFSHSQGVRAFRNGVKTSLVKDILRTLFSCFWGFVVGEGVCLIVCAIQKAGKQALL